jgi:hypothetical protein
MEKEVSGFVAQARTTLTVPLKVRGTGSAVRKKAVFRIRIRIRIQRIHMFLGLPDPDPDPLVRGTVIARISVTFSTLHSFISVKKFFDEHVYLTQNAQEP